MDLVEIFGDHDEYEGAQVTFRLWTTGEHIVVSLFKSDTIETPDKLPGRLPSVNQIIRLLGQSLTTDNYDEQKALEDEAVDPIYQAADAIISESEATVENSTTEFQSNYKSSSLHDILYPNTSHYRLQSTTRTTGPILIPIPAHEAYAISFDDGQALLEHRSEVQVDRSLPRYSSNQIQVVKEFAKGTGTVCLVTVDGQGQDQEFLCKAERDGLRNASLEREIDCLQRILQAPSSLTNNTTACPFPALRGYVVHPKTGAILGLLREWVPARYSFRDLEKAGLDGVDAPRELREKWAGQIKETVQALHSIGVVWGDAKPDNIIIDLHGDARLIDFGGGWTDGWVDEKLQETIEGDEQGVARILRLLDIDN
ncbi:Protein kinase 3 [Cytospora mali]|uniref:Protein kinase 3 n=1 Tax=Cytospora mali TaxID=578113 RepID=A0A194WDC8_CYTMA|nr:Protein kinase 3 [Valsa mali]